MWVLDFLKRRKKLSPEEIANLTVGSCMRREIIKLSPQDTLEKAVSTMEEEGVNFLVIAEGDELKGVLTDGDLISTIFKKKTDPSQVKIGEVMSQNLLTIKPNDTIVKALELMVENKIRRLPVVEDNKLVGLISLTDIEEVSGYHLTFSIT